MTVAVWQAGVTGRRHRLQSQPFCQCRFELVEHGLSFCSSDRKARRSNPLAAPTSFLLYEFDKLHKLVRGVHPEKREEPATPRIGSAKLSEKCLDIATGLFQETICYCFVRDPWLATQSLARPPRQAPGKCAPPDPPWSSMAAPNRTGAPMPTVATVDDGRGCARCL